MMAKPLCVRLNVFRCVPIAQQAERRSAFLADEEADTPSL